MIDFFFDHENKKWYIDFLNLNELEISDTNACKLVEHGFKAKDKYSYGVKGSEELAKSLLKNISELNKKVKSTKNKLDVHYCTCKLKDGVQLRNRIKRRAKSVAKAYDHIDEDGMLVRGAIYFDNIGKLNKVLSLLKENKVPKKFYELDKEKDGNKRILTTITVVEILKKDLKKYGKPAIVSEYPTSDCLNVETEFL